MEYHVMWEIEVEADSPREAAEEARAIQRDPKSTATVYEVRRVDDAAVPTVIDLVGWEREPYDQDADR